MPSEGSVAMSTWPQLSTNVLKILSEAVTGKAAKATAPAFCAWLHEQIAKELAERVLDRHREAKPLTVDFLTWGAVDLVEAITEIHVLSKAFTDKGIVGFCHELGFPITQALWVKVHHARQDGAWLRAKALGVDK